MRTVGVLDAKLRKMFAEYFQALHLKCQMCQVRLHLHRTTLREVTKLDQLLALRRLQKYQFRATRRFVAAHLFQA